MEFKIIENNNNVDVVLIMDGIESSKATCFLDNTPIVDGEKYGCVGNTDFKNTEEGKALLKKCEKIFANNNIKKIVAPMNGNTWKKYRTIKSTNGEDLFLLENVDPIENNEIFIEAGYNLIHTYTSNKGLIEDAYKSNLIDIAKENLEDEKITIRKFDKNNSIEDLKKIFNISKVSFKRNPFYTPIKEEEFLKQYEQYISMCDEDFILIAEKENKEIGFVFCIPNFNELKQGKKLETLILKTIAVLPEYENLAVGNVLLSIISETAKSKGFKEWIFAFMYSNNTSQKMASRNNAKTIREYALYGKDI